jgi:photosystem II stability/assembly factor-like uncharacterized protein
MKKISTLFAIALLFSLSIKAQLSWQPMAGAPKSYRVDDFYFVNPQKGWAISPNYDYMSPKIPGRIYQTNDGGVNWGLLVDSSKTFFRSIGFADSLTGWVGNLADSSATPDTVPLYHTSDGGKHWNPVTNIPNPKPKGICGISVVTDSIIYAYGRFYGPPVLIKTIDKGTTWTSQDMSAYASGLVDAHFFNKDTGFVTGCYDGTYQTGTQKALILSTFDGGVTWQIRHQSTRVQEEVWKIFFPSRMIGYATIEYQGTSATASTFFLKTTDGGITWTDMPFPLISPKSYDMEGVGFINDTIGWIGGDCESPTYKTTDGGITWNPDLSFGERSIYIECGNPKGLTMNRFRKFGDTLMYASGYTVCRLAPPYIPIPHFHASSQVVCAGSSITFSDSTTNTWVRGWQWDFPGGTLAGGYTLTDSMPKVIYPTPGTYPVSYTASTSAGHASVIKTSYIHVEPATGTYSVTFSEGFETAAVPGTDWSVSNTGGSNWMLTSTAAATGKKSVMINNMTNVPNDTSTLTGPTFNLAAIGSPVLAFSMSYQQKILTNTDKLQVYISTDCGITWVSKWSRSGTALQPVSVSGQSTSSFIPDSMQFTTYTVNINSAALNTNVMFRWVFYSGAPSVGNNIYLDDINISNAATGIKNIETAIDLNMYPNPSTGNVNIAFNLEEKHLISIQVVDMLGRVVETIPPQVYATGESTIGIGNKTSYQSGVYFVSVNVDGQIISKKVIIQ